AASWPTARRRSCSPAPPIQPSAPCSRPPGARPSGCARGWAHEPAPMTPRLQAAFDLLPEYLGWHVLLSVSALALGLVISLPLAIAAARSPRLRWPVLALASLIQTIPSLALLALFFPLLLALSALSVAATG